MSHPEEYLVKAELAAQITKLVNKRKLTQVAAAKLLGINQPKISALTWGRLSGFSVERLFKLLSILDQDIEIVIKPHSHCGREKNSSPHIHVRCAAP